MSADLQALIERLAASEGPDRELDALIAMATGPWTQYDLGDGCWQWRFNGVNTGARPPHYTSSVDAALTLVPAEQQFGFNMDCENTHGGWCGYVWLNHPTAESTYARTRGKPTMREMLADVPRVICIAALKARA